MSHGAENENQSGPIERSTDEILVRFAEKVLENQAAQIELQKRIYQKAISMLEM
jgi:hypothetical protein